MSFISLLNAAQKALQEGTYAEALSLATQGLELHEDELKRYLQTLPHVTHKSTELLAFIQYP